MSDWCLFWLGTSVPLYSTLQPLEGWPVAPALGLFVAETVGDRTGGRRPPVVYGTVTYHTVHPHLASTYPYTHTAHGQMIGQIRIRCESAKHECDYFLSLFRATFLRPSHLI